MKTKVPFLRPHLGEEEITEVIKTLKSGWLTSGPQVKKFEESFAKAVKADYAVALNSCTAALHLAVDALGLAAGDGVLIPTMTFAATAEIVLYKAAVPILVDCDPVTGNMDLNDAEEKLNQFYAGKISNIANKNPKVVGIIPVHVGGYMMDIQAIKDFATKHNLWIVEDGAHAFPAAWRPNNSSEWEFCGQNTAAITCYSFYANKTITTGEGGMAVTGNQELADRIRLMSLHGLSNDAWGRFSGKGAWDYQIVSPGYKYNLTDIAAAIGIHQLAKAEQMRVEREEVAKTYLKELGSVEEFELPVWDENRVHSWHLFPLRLKLEKLNIDRNTFMEELKQKEIGCSVHWRPLHLHPLYGEKLGWSTNSCPNANVLWKSLVSLPIFPAMEEAEIGQVVDMVKQICATNSVRKSYQIV